MLALNDVGDILHDDEELVMASPYLLYLDLVVLDLALVYLADLLLRDVVVCPVAGVVELVQGLRCLSIFWDLAILVNITLALAQDFTLPLWAHLEVQTGGVLLGQEKCFDDVHQGYLLGGLLILKDRAVGDQIWFVNGVLQLLILVVTQVPKRYLLLGRPAAVHRLGVILT